MATEMIASTNEFSDGDLVNQARAGSRSAETELYLRYRQMGHGLANRRLRNADVEDVVQEAFLEAFSRLEQIKNPQAFARWFGSIVIGRIDRRLRSPAHRRMLVDTERCERTACRNLDAEAMADMSRFLRLAGENLLDGPALLLCLEGWSLPEVAKKLKTSLSTVKRRLLSARTRIAACHGIEVRAPVESLVVPRATHHF